MAATNLAEFYRGAEAAARALQAARTTSSAGSAATRVHAAIDALRSEPDDDRGAACRAGCAHCCHYPVGVTFPEAVALAAVVAAAPALRERALAAADATSGLAWTQLVGRACPLLDAGVCAAYAARPLPCRSLASRDASACERALTAATAAVPRDEAAYWRGLGASAELARMHGVAPRELRAALAALLRAPEGADADAALAAFPACRATDDVS